MTAGRPPAVTLADGFNQGPAGTGTQGMGVKTPSAAAVAAATDGFAGLLHIPKEGILTMGPISVSTPAGRPDIITRGTGSALKGAGAKPKGH